MTDANVVLGRLPRTLAGGLELDEQLAAAAVTRFAEQLGVSLEEAAAGIIEIVNENMAAALRVKTIERGLDPRDFMLTAFGGAGPLHAVDLARLLGMPEVLIPPNPGVTSAAGLLASSLRYDVVQSVLRPVGDLDPGAVDQTFKTHEQALRERLLADGCKKDRIEISWGADLRYRGQGYELNVVIEDRPFSIATSATLRTAFDNAHRAEFGHDFPEYDAEIVNLRVTAVGRILDFAQQPVRSASVGEAKTGERQAFFRIAGTITLLPTAVYERDRLPVGETVSGPAIVVQPDSTTLVPPEAAFARDEAGNLHIKLVAE